MDLTSDHPFWAVKNGLLANYPTLHSDTSCDIAILGAGITGALLGEALSADGYHVVLLDARDVCHGSTCASTALLQYEIDTHLIDLIRMHGETHARLAYQSCHESIDRLEKRIQHLNIDCAFTRRDSVYLASKKRHLPDFEKEAAARRSIGIEVNEWNSADVRDHFGFSYPGALHSTQAAEVDAFRLAHGLLAAIASRGGRIYDRTRVDRIEHGESGVLLRTSNDLTVRAKHLVVAAGYEAASHFDIDKFVRLRSSYAIASEPIQTAWWNRCLLWESARPYFYLRSDSDGRAIIGGEDMPFRNPTARDKLIPRKTRRLEKRFGGLFPELPWQTSYAWAGTFGETPDGLAYIGPWEKYPHTFFALGFGGNGITYSQVAADIIRHQIRGQSHPYAEVFRFDR